MNHDLTANVFRPEILSLSAYKVADPGNLIKLDAMENPYCWPEPIVERWLTALQSCPINRYPDPEARQLAAILRTTNDIPEQAAVLFGNGSDEIIQILLMALRPGAAVLTPEPGFVMYRQVARSLGLSFHGIPLQPDTFELDLPAMLQAITAHNPALVFLAYPNNPTGNLFDAQAITTILSHSQGLVVIDEAYAPFADATFMDRLPQYDNLMVMRTLSKLGLAGLRLGFLAGAQRLIAELNKIRLPYNINSLTQLTAEFALHNIGFLQDQTRILCEQRTVVFDELNRFDGITAYPSAANFILFKVRQASADLLFQRIKQQGVLIKNLAPQGGLLSDCLRVTIGKPEENRAFLNALSNSLID